MANESEMIGISLRSSGTKRPASWLAAVAVLGTIWLATPPGVVASPSAEPCATAGRWLDPASGVPLASDALVEGLAGRRIVLLGESHDRRDHHAWQLHTLAGLLAHRSSMVVGFEMFPRSVQPALDLWSEGLSDEAEFFEASRWREVWGFEPELYMPLFRFARQNRLAMVALNVDRELVSRVGQEGWSAIPEAEREGISGPAPASDAYRLSLAGVYGEKLRQGVTAAGHDGEDTAPEIDEILGREDFARFVEAQLTWDRAMAEALAAAAKEHPAALIVGVMGRGHVEHGHGVPHQLADLGESDVAVLLPVETGAACEALEPAVADAVFLLDPAGADMGQGPKPRLGVMIEDAENGVRVVEVIEGTVAAASGLLAGDVIVGAATFPTGRVADLIEVVQRQAPGTWLPLELERDGESLSLVAKFPASFE